MLIASVIIAILLVRLLDASITIARVRNYASFSLRNITNGVEQRELDELQQKCTKEKGLIRFLRRTLFAHYQLCEEIRSGELLSFVQYVMKFRKYLQLYFVFFPPIFKDISVDHNNNGKLMKQFAKKELHISISDNVNFMFQFAKRTIIYLSAVVLSRTASVPF